jgi:uncharacterized protein DUF3892
MAKWADYLITAVRFNSAGTHIEYVQRRKDEDDKAGATSESSRAQIVASLESGTTYCTATKDGSGNLQMGAAVRIVTIEGTKFIKTKADGIKKDNLDNLPSF